MKEEFDNKDNKIDLYKDEECTHKTDPAFDDMSDKEINALLAENSSGSINSPFAAAYIIISICAIPISSLLNYSTTLILMIFGHFWFAIGLLCLIAAIKSEKGLAEKFLPSLFMLLGLGIMGTTFVYSVGYTQILPLVFGILPYGFAIIICISGLVPFIFAYRASIAKMRNCTYSVTGTCVDFEEIPRINDGRWVNGRYVKYAPKLMPIYEIEYRGIKMRISDGELKSKKSLKIGDTRSLRINPDNPAECYQLDNMIATTLIDVAVGTVTVGMGIFVLLVLIAA